ncbi:ATP-dependent helicase [Oceanivirga miroungae]|uniref:DNA 3'-5' helicase n=1 Tax=Oceanivirga miroungae TaxID=1130046 RepID=A0A6I8MDW8_9FUSO|nr:UvrD-helicase domain-containing protein [Oceanivirga miroungae]VWL85634.1 UvrD/REP helicase [Oceanivirga miroungae]
MSILDNLNDMQKKAAKLVEGPGLILAGAGSGKTRTITYKIAYMVKEMGIEKENILALTFTNKAANEMKERIKKLMNENTADMQVSTFHSFGVKLLRMYGSNIGFTSNFNIYDTDDSMSIIKKIIKKLVLRNELTPRAYLAKISKLKEDEIMPEDYEKMVNISINANREFYDIYKEYQDELKKSNSMDFSDILYYTKKLTENKRILPILQDRYRYILVDEYQDTNKLQYAIIKNLASKYKNIWVVGDEDQSIYAFRGADISNILNFEKDYDNVNIIRLEQNYRSTSNILNLANSVIKNNMTSLGKKLWTTNEEGKKIVLFDAETPYQEARYIAKVIKLSNRNLNEFAILYRTNYQSRIIEQELLAEGIKSQVYGGLSFYSRKEIKDLMSYLILINNPNDSVNFERAITNPKRKIGAKTIADIVEYANKNNLNYIEALDVNNTAKLKEFKNLMEYLIDFSENNNISSLLQEIIDKTEYLAYIEKEDNYEDRVLNIQELYNSIIEIEKNNTDLKLDEYIQTISLSSSLDDMSDNSVVKLMTIHSSKGLEFETVFLAGFESGLFPNSKSLEDENEIEEERRLLYVALTRAEKELYLTYSKSRMVNGVTIYNKMVSEFFYDMDKNYINHINKIENPYKKPASNVENFNPLKKIKNDSKYKIGQIVIHKSYGKGKVKKVDDKAITVEFSVGEKRIAANLADKFLI